MGLYDVAAERAILSGIYNYGDVAYHEVADLLSEDSFTIDSNAVIFKCLKHAIEHREIKKLDIPSIYSSASELGLGDFFQKRGEAEHLTAVFDFAIDPKNILSFAKKVRKLEVFRHLHMKVGGLRRQIGDLDGSESVNSIVGECEKAIDLTNIFNDSDAPSLIGNDIEDYVQYLIDNPVEQIGTSTGYARYDQCIGGGLRDGSISVIGARLKVGKTMIIDNIALHICKHLKIPVLNLDTEMLKSEHYNRMLAMMSGVDTNDIETGKFGKRPDSKGKVLKAMRYLKDMPYHHREIDGHSIEEQLWVMRRWLIKEVGLNKDGTAKPCVIMYDYLKLMDSAGLANAQEYQLLGFVMAALHDFVKKYKIPMLMTIQLNRDGIDRENSSVISGSDRIGWLCGNVSIFKDKSADEMAESSDNGNKKLIPIVSRHGAGLHFGNYIGMQMEGRCARITECKTKLESRDVDEGFKFKKPLDKGGKFD